MKREAAKLRSRIPLLRSIQPLLYANSAPRLVRKAVIPAIHEQKEYLITGPNSPLRPAGHKLQYWSVLDTAKMKKKKTGHENKGVLELKTSYLRWTVEARNWLLISPILLSLNARAEAVEAVEVDGATDDLEEDMFVVLRHTRRGERGSPRNGK